MKVTVLRKRADFLRLNRGKKFITDYFVLRYAPAVPESKLARVGFTVTTKCGNAVIRNRIKRRMRALVAELAPLHMREGMDYVFITRAEAKPGMAEVEFPVLRAMVERAFIAAGK